MKEELREFFQRCIEAVETDNIDTLPEDLEKAAEAIRKGRSKEILEY